MSGGAPAKPPPPPPRSGKIPRASEAKAREPSPGPPPIGLPYVAANEAPRPRKRLRLGELLVQAGVCDEQAVERALAVQKMGGGRLGSILVNLKLADEGAIREALSRQLGVEVVQLDQFKPDQAVLNLLPREMVRRYEAIPLRKDGKTLHVAMKDPYNLTAIDDIRFYTGCQVVVCTCTESEFVDFLKEHLESESLIDEILAGGRFMERAVDTVEVVETDLEEDEILHDLKIAGEQPPIITLCNFMLVESINRRASDIHIEPYETYFRVRLRIDGALQNLITPPQRLHSAIITRMKIMAEMDIAKRRCPQDGHIAINYRGEVCHYRVSTLPTVYGEKCVIRLLKKDAGLQDIDTLGFDANDLKQLKRALRMPQGIVLVTGPTGSGKTTTLHAGLAHINDTDLNIVTLEDPVEASIPGVNHVQINEAAGVTFGSGLRSILRQDPDVVFVGEMRDEEVSKIAVKAALTGHLVLSTLHTNSAAESLIRLQDLGVPRYLLANALSMIIAQRLVRKVCEACADVYRPSEDEVEYFRLTKQHLAKANFRQGNGCYVCHDTGYQGRLAVYEVLTVSNQLRAQIRAGDPTEKLVETAKKGGLRLLFEAGLEKALLGYTTLKEVQRRLSDAQ